LLLRQHLLLLLWIPTDQLTSGHGSIASECGHGHHSADWSVTLWHSRHNSASLGHLLGEKLLLLLLLGIVATARASILTHSIRQTVELTCEQIKTR